MTRTLGVLIVLCASWSTTASGQEEEATLEARAVFEQGENEYGRGHYALALQSFERAYALLEGHPRRALVLFNIGTVYEELDQLEDARDAFVRYLEEGADIATNIADTRARIADLEARIALRDRREPGAPTEAGEADATTSPAVDGRGDAGGGVGVGAIVLLGLGSAALVASAVTGALALGAAGDLEAACPNDRCPDDPALRSRANEARTLSTVTDVLWPIGTAAATAGLIWLIIEATSAPDDTATAGVACDGAGCVGVMRGSF